MSVEAPAPGSAPGFPESASQPDSLPQGAPGVVSRSAGAQPRCDNCGANVPGRYCGVCGQRLEPPVHSLGHFAKVATEDLTHADSRLWRTLLALLVKPGMLTREFLAGRRARYLPPVRLYLVVSLVFFLWAAVHSANDTNSIAMVKFDAPPTAHAAAASPTAAPPSAAPPSAAPPSAAPPSAAPPAAAPAAATSAPGSRHVSVKSGADPQDCVEVSQMVSDGSWAQRFRPLIRESCEKMVKDNGRAVSQGMMHNLPRAMFVFLPLLAAAMMLFYWRPRRYYVEHLLFLLHNHVFVFFFLMLMWVPMALIPPIAPLIGTAGGLYMIWYVYRAMRVVYGQGRALTTAKLAAMSFVYLVFGALMLVITTVYSVLTS